MGCSSWTTTTTKTKQGNNLVSYNRLDTQINNEEEIKDELILEYEKDINKMLQNLNNIYKNKGIELKNLSKYYIYPKKDYVDSKFSNQIIMIFTHNINPFEENIYTNKYIQEVKSEIKILKKSIKINIILYLILKYFI